MLTSEMSTKPKAQMYLILLLIYCILVGFLVIIYIIQIPPQVNQYRISYHLPKTQGTRTIVLWDTFFGNRWGLPNDTLGPDYFRDQQCPVVNCELTNNKGLLSEVELFDAVVFHIAEPWTFSRPLPKKRRGEQYYVFAIMEPPGKTTHVLDKEGGVYNLTMSYRLDSDIVWPYMFFEDIESGALVAPASNPSWRKVPAEYSDETLDKIVAGKTKFAAWFVSNCKSLSQREKLTESLQKYIDVDVFGACGPLKCPKTSSECDLMLDTDYKFYFAFENALCLDYVTEKLLKALNRHIVPVVFGGANYTKMAPPNSYINVEDFKTVKELADYLIYLDNHPKEYARYFWWRQYYRVKSKLPFCDLCAKLNKPSTKNKVQFYANIKNWWLGHTCRFEPKILL